MKNSYGIAMPTKTNNTIYYRNQLNKFYSLSLFFFTLIIILFTFGSCSKDGTNAASEDMQSANNPVATAEAGVLTNYTGLSFQTFWQLQQARAATAKYRHFDNAINDGYSDINVIVAEMGYHYLKAANLDINFDFRKPEILVYNKEEDGSMELVAVEYAVPINLTPNTAPAGFDGTGDVWDRNTFFGLWLLHAWVWSYNPNGVFNPTNPLVHLH